MLQLNLNPIEGRMIWDADSISVPDPDNPIGRYYPYFDHVMGAGSDLYNMYEAHTIAVILCITLSKLVAI